MATVRHATLVAKQPIGDHSAELRFQVEEGPLGFIGGQYLFFDTGLPHRDPKRTLKKAYSILSPDSQQQAFTIAVRRLKGGAGSNFMAELEVGATLPISGPYGRLANGLPEVGAAIDKPAWPNYDKDRAKEPGFNSMRPTRLVVATDTGITAAIGLLSGARYKPFLSETQLIWVAEHAREFLGIDGVNRFMNHQVGEFRFFDAGSSLDAQRDADEKFYGALGQCEAAAAYLIGDGRLIHKFIPKLVATGTAEEAITVEYFFNRPPKT